MGRRPQLTEPTWLQRPWALTRATTSLRLSLSAFLPPSITSVCLFVGASPSALTILFLGLVTSLPPSALPFCPSSSPILERLGDFVMHLRSLPRWASLAPKTYAISNSFPTISARATYSTATIESRVDGSETTTQLLETIEAAFAASDRSSKGKGKRDKVVKVCRIHFFLVRTL